MGDPYDLGGSSNFGMFLFGVAMEFPMRQSGMKYDYKDMYMYICLRQGCYSWQAYVIVFCVIEDLLKCRVNLCMVLCIEEMSF